VCASVTAGIDLGWLGVEAALFGGVLIYVLARAKARPSRGLAVQHSYLVVGALRGIAPSVWLPANG